MKAVMEELIASAPASTRLVQQGLAIAKVAALIRGLMKEKNVSNADLARQLGKDPGYVSRVLAGKMNLTLSTVADLLWALEFSLEVSAKTLEKEPEESFAPRPGWADEWQDSPEALFWLRARGSEREN
jgi:transcriptional regulator with XRE-family HTH domain